MRITLKEKAEIYYKSKSIYNKSPMVWIYLRLEVWQVQRVPGSGSQNAQIADSFLMNL